MPAPEIHSGISDSLSETLSVCLVSPPTYILTYVHHDQSNRWESSPCGREYYPVNAVRNAQLPVKRRRFRYPFFIGVARIEFIIPPPHPMPILILQMIMSAASQIYRFLRPSRETP